MCAYCVCVLTVCVLTVCVLTVCVCLLCVTNMYMYMCSTPIDPYLQIVMRHSAAVFRHILLWAGQGRDTTPNNRDTSLHLTRSSTAGGLRRRQVSTERRRRSRFLRLEVSGESVRRVWCVGVGV